MNKGSLIILCLGIIGLVALTYFSMAPKSNNKSGTQIKYVALGDSYTIGEGASKDQSWPALLTQELKQAGINIELIANPSVTGYTTQDLINRELPVFESSKPDFATLQIGVNDWVQGVGSNTFKANLSVILDRMEAKLTNPKNLILVTIPDFSVTPTGKQFSNGRNIPEGISLFNDIIASEGKKRGLRVVDIYLLSQEMKKDPIFIAKDGLHPSAKEYDLWEKVIYPEAQKLLK